MRLLKSGKNIVIAIIIFFVVLVMFKNKIVEISTERICTHILGVKLDIETMKVGIIRPVIDIRGLKVYNPKGYPEKLMIDVSTIYIVHDFSSFLMEGRIYIDELNFDLKEFNIIKNENGEININSLNPIKDKADGATLEKESKGKVPDIEIKVLHLKAGDVYYKDYSNGSPPKVQRFKINLQEKYENISDPYTLVRLIISRSLFNTSISHIINVPMNGVKSVIDVGKVAVTDTMKTATGAAGTIVGKTGGALKSTALGLENALATPFSAINGNRKETQEQ